MCIETGRERGQAVGDLHLLCLRAKAREELLIEERTASPHRGNPQRLEENEKRFCVQSHAVPPRRHPPARCGKIVEDIQHATESLSPIPKTPTDFHANHLHKLRSLTVKKQQSRHQRGIGSVEEEPEAKGTRIRNTPRQGFPRVQDAPMKDLRACGDVRETHRTAISRQAKHAIDRSNASLELSQVGR
jgi:hypothetical protein